MINTRPVQDDSGGSSSGRTKKSHSSYGVESFTATPKSRGKFSLRMSSTPQSLTHQREGSARKTQPPVSRERKFAKPLPPPVDVEMLEEGEGGWGEEGEGRGVEAAMDVDGVEPEGMKEQDERIEPISVDESPLDV